VRRRTIVIATFFVLVVAISSAVILNALISPQIKPKYEIKIDRITGSQTREDALAAAESINYSEVTNRERFNGSSDPEDYLHPKTYLAYTFANYIDSETLSYYQDRYDSLQGKGSPSVIEYSYCPKVSEYQNFCIYNTPAPDGAGWHNYTVVTVADGSVECYSEASQIYTRNATGYQLSEWEYDFKFRDCIVVDMTLEYKEVYAPLAAFLSGVHQIVVLDRNYSPLLIAIAASQIVA